MGDSSVPTPAALRRPTPVSVGRPTALANPASSSTATDAAAFGRVDPDGTVYLRAPEGEVAVGQWAAGAPEEGLAFFARKYEDLVVEVDLITARVADGRASGEQAEGVVAKVRAALTARSFVGDVAALEARVETLAAAASAARDRARERRAAERAAALDTRSALVAEAESLATSTAWKSTAERYAAIVEQWKAIPRADRATEQELWKRISAARTTFDKRRRSHFAEVDAQRKDVIAGKRALIARAEVLAQSTDWQRIGKQLRDLLDEWKALPRASRADEEKLWKRFKAVQDAFYAARSAAAEASEDELRGNIPAKEALAAEAEALLPVTDLAAAKRALRGIQERWDKAGDLPKSDRGRLEARLKKVEDAVRSQQDAAWSTAKGTVATDAFTQALERLQAKRDAAAARGDARATADLDSQIASTKALMGQA